MADALVALRVYSQPPRAHLARTLLEEAGIPAIVRDDTIAGVYALPMGRLALCVREADVERAEALLAPEDDPDAPSAEEIENPVDPAELERQALAAAPADVAPTADPEGGPSDHPAAAESLPASDARSNEPRPPCPACGSAEVGVEHFATRPWWALFLVTKVPPRVRRRFLCTSCGRRFLPDDVT